MRVMYKKVLKSINLWSNSFTLALGILAFIETILAVADFKLSDLISLNEWWIRLLLVLGVFIAIGLIIALFKSYLASQKVEFKIRDTTIIIKCGDIFKSQGWKIIPFNEFYDTNVDDKTIAYNSLNGTFISDYVSNVDDLRRVITQDYNSLKQNQSQNSDHLAFPLGHIITYDDYMLLAFSHFNNNQASLTHHDYEQCLRMMWSEVSRVYANRPITMPLLGGGITRFDDVEKTDSYLLNCLLLTLKMSNARIYQSITIVLSKEAMKNVNLYDIKTFFKI